MRAYRPRQTRWISSADFRAKSSPAGLGSTMSGAQRGRAVPIPKDQKIENCYTRATEELSNVPTPGVPRSAPRVRGAERAERPRRAGGAPGPARPPRIPASQESLSRALSPLKVKDYTNSPQSSLG